MGSLGQDRSCCSIVLEVDAESSKAVLQVWWSPSGRPSAPFFLLRGASSCSVELPGHSGDGSRSLIPLSL